MKIKPRESPERVLASKLDFGSELNSLASEGTTNDIVDLKFNKMLTNQSLDLKESTIEVELNIISVKELHMYTKQNRDKKTNDSE